MAKSKAKKLREKLVREGRRNPENDRSAYAMADLRTRTTKTKQEKLNKVYKKERQSRYGEETRENVVLFSWVRGSGEILYEYGYKARNLSSSVEWPLSPLKWLKKLKSGQKN
ncbi:hypothetical protein FIU87_18360 [Bacillus sp. THAF10]|uniref:hypothetical protein n=1 Tax=Bacillus sp. THAF10 TaxID=2587848 RepID=UPI0012693854|nr:hypothetical protein [Bacillus sp. THAF10]QFT90611.1 hypothetical protein FIU87_18360 [Bacillus sp. THAF10]